MDFCIQKNPKIVEFTIVEITVYIDPTTKQVIAQPYTDMHIARANKINGKRISV